MSKTRRRVEWEIPQGKNPRIIVIVRESGSLGTTQVSLTEAELDRTLGLLQYVKKRRGMKK